MSHMRLWTAATIIAFVIIAGFILSVPRARDIVKAPGLQTASTTVSSVTLHDTFKKGIHTITGSVVAPNACSHFSAEATIARDTSSTQNIRVVITMSVGTGVCLQLPTQINFSTSISAPANLPLVATVNGSVATTTVL